MFTIIVYIYIAVPPKTGRPLRAVAMTHSASILNLHDLALRKSFMHLCWKMRNAGVDINHWPGRYPIFHRVWIKSLSPNIYWDLPFFCTLVWNKFIRYLLETRINKKKEKDTKNPDVLEKTEQRAQKWQMSTWRQMSVAPQLCPGLALTCKITLESGCYSTGADHSPFHQ